MFNTLMRICDKKKVENLKSFWRTSQVVSYLYSSFFSYSSVFLVSIETHKIIIACVAGPQFYGGPDLQRAGFWRASHKTEGLPRRLIK